MQIFIYLLFTIFLSLYNSIIESEPKKILIFTSKGGGGHISASKALGFYLHKYNIKIVNFAEEVIPPLDIIKRVSFGKLSGEGLYNQLIKRQWLNLINSLYDIASWAFKYQRKPMENFVFKYLIKEKPDLIISVIPIVNFAIVKPAKKLGIPFLIIPTDFDITPCIQNMKPVGYDRCKINLPFNIPAMYQKATTIFKKDQIINLGFPIRPEFFKSYNKRAIKREFKIPLGKPVIMILMGAIGSYASYKYVKALSKTNLNIHLLVCLGQNIKLKQEICKISLPKNISLSVIGFTDKIAQLMTISDGIITKSGSISTCESLYMDLPILIDNTTNCLKWEKFNHQFIKENNFGEIINRFQDLEKIIYNNIFDQKNRSSIKKNIKNLNKKNFNKNINILVQNLVF